MKILKITTDWSAEEAEGICQLLDGLKEAIWKSCGEDILEMHKTMQLEKQHRRLALSRLIVMVKYSRF